MSLCHHVIQFGDFDTEKFTLGEDEDGSEDDSDHGLLYVTRPMFFLFPNGAKNLEISQCLSASEPGGSTRNLMHSFIVDNKETSVVSSRAIIEWGNIHL